jgi:hypothetical protein
MPGLAFAMAMNSARFFAGNDRFTSMTLARSGVPACWHSPPSSDLLRPAMLRGSFGRPASTGCMIQSEVVAKWATVRAQHIGPAGAPAEQKFPNEQRGIDVSLTISRVEALTSFPTASTWETETGRSVWLARFPFGTDFKLSQPRRNHAGAFSWGI